MNERHFWLHSAKGMELNDLIIAGMRLSQYMQADVYAVHNGIPIVITPQTTEVEPIVRAALTELARNHIGHDRCLLCGR